jgi:hypothetical protein
VKVKEKQPYRVLAEKVDKEKFLSKLEEVLPGLAKSEIVDQATCFVFKSGKVITYNEEVACKANSGLPKEAQGAVQSGKFLEMLRRLPDVIVDIEFTKKEIKVIGRNKYYKQTIEHQVLIPVDVVKTPENWTKIDSNFSHGVSIVQNCATKNESAFTLTCLHIHPKWIEAFDNSQMARYEVKTKVTSPFLVKRDSIKFLGGNAYDLKYIAESDRYLHFKTRGRTIISILRYVSEASEYQNLSDVFKMKGSRVTFPKNLKDAAELANIASSENSDNNLVTVELRAGKLRIIGQGDQVYYEQRMKTKYGGPELKFKISPGMLIEILTRETDCEIKDGKHLKVVGENWTYVACLEDIK